MWGKHEEFRAKRTKKERTKGYFNKKKIKPQWEEQDIRNKDDETKIPPLPLLLPQTANNNKESKKGSLRLSILNPLFCWRKGEILTFRTSENNIC